MLTKNRIDELIRLKEIAISYSFGLKDGRWNEFENEEFVDPDKPQVPANRLFDQHFFGDRLTVTLGPIVKTHKRHWPSNRARFKNRDGYFDLRVKSLILQPRETVSIGTNERIILKGKIAAITLPRLTNVDAGLLYIPSYIDPYWDGILQAVVHNMTDRQQELSLCERVAICRFYRIEGNAPESDARRFAAKSHHYGQSWPKILKEDFDPFPTKKSPVEETLTQKYINKARRFWEQQGGLIKGVGLTGSAVAVAYGLGVAWTNLKRDIVDKGDQLEQEIKQIRNSDLSAISNKVVALSDNIPQSGIVNVQFKNGETQAKLTFPITHSRLNVASIWMQLENPSSTLIEVNGRLDLLPGRTDTGNVLIDLQRPTAGNEVMVRVKWLLLLD